MSSFISSVSSSAAIKSIDIFVNNNNNNNNKMNSSESSLESEGNLDFNSEKNKNNVDNLKGEKETTVNYKELAENLKKMTKVDGVYFEFVYDKESKEMLMKVINEDTKEVVKQYPSEITLKIAKIINDALGQGQIANVKI